MRARMASLALFLALCLGAQGIDAKPRKKAVRSRKAKPEKVVATKKTQAGIGQLMGKYKWGMSVSQILDFLEKDLVVIYQPKIRETIDPLAQDRLRKEMREKVKELRKSHVQFTGKTTPWDVSLVDKQFAHKNNESMIPVWGKRDRKFYFFHSNRLWKLYIAFNTELFAGKTFEDFAAAMEDRFGKAERKFTTTMTGQSKMDHMAWPPSGRTQLKAIDNTGFYGNFCLVLEDVKEQENLMEGRRLSSPKKAKYDPLVDAVTKDDGTVADANEDIVDRITGKGVSPPPTGTSSTSSTSSSSSSSSRSREPSVPPPPKKKKKIDTSNPLDGLDI